jgi:hypothetical protein
MAKAPEAARILARRFNARHRYRVKRDHRIAEGLLGKTFRDSMKHTWRLTSYNPVAHTVTFVSDFLNRRTISTDDFWKLYKSGVWTEWP